MEFLLDWEWQCYRPGKPLIVKTKKTVWRETPNSGMVAAKLQAEVFRSLLAKGAITWFRVVDPTGTVYAGGIRKEQ